MTTIDNQMTATLVPDDQVPVYAPMLEAYHEARAPELRAMIDSLPLTPHSRVLDLACGDGWYSIELAQRAAEVVAVDLSSAYLALAHSNAQASDYAARIRFEQADAAALPFDDASFDLAWCAQSFYTLPDPLAALREMIRVTRPGGAVVVLENDSLHQILLPWPAELELAVRQAQLQALAKRHQQQGPDKFYIGRNLCGLFRQCGIECCTMQTVAVERRAPFSAAEATFLRHYFAELRELTWEYLDPAARSAYDTLFDPESEAYLLDQPDCHITHLEALAVGTK